MNDLLRFTVVDHQTGEEIDIASPACDALWEAGLHLVPRNEALENKIFSPFVYLELRIASLKGPACIAYVIICGMWGSAKVAVTGNEALKKTVEDFASTQVPLIEEIYFRKVVV